MNSSLLCGFLLFSPLAYHQKKKKKKSYVKVGVPHFELRIYVYVFWGELTRQPNGKEFACQCRRCRRLGFHLWIRKIPWRRKWQPTAVFLPGKFHGQRSLVG